MAASLRVIFAGTPDFAVPPLRALLESPHEVLTSRLALGLVASCITNAIPVYISIPTRPGHTHALVGLNERLAQPVRARKLDLARKLMLATIEYAAKLSTETIEPLSD